MKNVKKKEKAKKKEKKREKNLVNGPLWMRAETPVGGGWHTPPRVPLVAGRRP
jgi:hypothetical protein